VALRATETGFPSVCVRRWGYGRTPPRRGYRSRRDVRTVTGGLRRRESRRRVRRPPGWHRGVRRRHRVHRRRGQWHLGGERNGHSRRDQGGHCAVGVGSDESVAVRVGESVSDRFRTAQWLSGGSRPSNESLTSRQDIVVGDPFVLDGRNRVTCLVTCP